MRLGSTTKQRRIAVAILVVLPMASPAFAHDLERTSVTLTFARDGSFVLDVANDPDWLKLRLEGMSGSFADRVVLWVDGHEIRPASVEYLPSPGPSTSEDRALPATYRMRGRMPVGAQTLRWYYGLVIDPYPLTVHRTDGRIIVEEIGGDAWSRTIDMSGQFQDTQSRETTAIVLIVGLLLVPLAIRLAAKRTRPGAKGRL